MQSRVNRAEQLLDEMSKNPLIELTEEGRAWLTAVTDPFHDRNLKDKLVGWPDPSIANSIVRCVRQSATISCTSGGGAAVTAPWDAHIAMFPTLTSFGMLGTSSRINNSLKWNALPTQELGGIVVNMVTTSGANNSWSLSATSTNILANITCPDAYLQGSGRLIAGGFEVRDVTAEIYKQGTSTSYRYPQGKRRTHYTGTNTVPTDPYVDLYNFDAIDMNLPPISIAQAMLYPGSIQMKSSEGVYQVTTFNDLTNVPTQNGYTLPVYHANADADAAGAATTNSSVVLIPNPVSLHDITAQGLFTPEEFLTNMVKNNQIFPPKNEVIALLGEPWIFQVNQLNADVRRDMMEKNVPRLPLKDGDHGEAIVKRYKEIGDLFGVKVGAAGDVLVTLGLVAAPPCRIENINGHGVIFSGLNPNSVLNLTAIWYIEVFPTVAEDILTLAVPSCEYDPMAIKLYTRMMDRMPVAVPVSMNPLGEWFSDVVGEAARFLGPVLSLIPHPVAQAGSVLANTIGATLPKRQQIPPPNGNGSGFTGKRQIQTEVRKRRKVKSKNAKLASGNRGKRGKIQGPVNRSSGKG